MVIGQLVNFPKMMLSHSIVAVIPSGGRLACPYGSCCRDVLEMEARRG